MLLFSKHGLHVQEPTLTFLNENPINMHWIQSISASLTNAPN